MHHGPSRRNAQRGQILIVFTLALVSIIAMTGLIIDGGDTFVQRRGMQNVADAAAMAGAYSYTNTTGTNGVRAAAAVTAGTSMAAQNGYPSGVTVVVTPAVNGATVVATASLPHRNWFSGIVGFPSWQVTTTASAITGQPTGVFGLMPIIVNKAIFAGGGGLNVPIVLDEPLSGQTPADIPIGTTQFNWTNFCTAGGNVCNADSTSVNDLIAAGGEPILVTLNDHINPLNAGAHATLFTSLAGAVEGDYPIAVVDDAGTLQGFAVLHLTGSVGGSTKQISGYFMTGSNPDFVLDPSAAVPPFGNVFGQYIVKLTN